MAVGLGRRGGGAVSRAGGSQGGARAAVGERGGRQVAMYNGHGQAELDLQVGGAIPAGSGRRGGRPGRRSSWRLGRPRGLWGGTGGSAAGTSGWAGSRGGLDGESSSSRPFLNFCDDLRGGGLGASGDGRFFFLPSSLSPKRTVPFDDDDDEVRDSLIAARVCGMASAVIRAFHWARPGRGSQIWRGWQAWASGQGCASARSGPGTATRWTSAWCLGCRGPGRRLGVAGGRAAAHAADQAAGAREQRRRRRQILGPDAVGDLDRLAGGGWRGPGILVAVQLR